VVSVDAKKKEQVGQYAQKGREWRPEGDPVRVRDHGTSPMRTWEGGPRTGFTISAPTPGGCERGHRPRHRRVRGGIDPPLVERPRPALEYPAARRLLISADAGGSNGYRTRDLEGRPGRAAAETGLEITCCHFPPGTSKWNKIEHRLFSAITMNWARPAPGQPRSGREHHRRHHHPHRAERATPSWTPAPARPGSRSAKPRWTPCRWPSPRLARRVELQPCTPRQPPPPAAPTAPAPRRPARPAGPGLARSPRHHRMPGPALDALTDALTGPRRRPPRSRPGRRRGYRPRRFAPGTGPRPRHTLAGKLTAAILHDRHGLASEGHRRPVPDHARKSSAAHTGDIRRLLHQAGHIIQPARPS